MTSIKVGESIMPKESKKRSLQSQVASTENASLLSNAQNSKSKKQRLAEVSAFAKQRMLDLLTDDLSADPDMEEWEKLVALTKEDESFEKKFSFPNASKAAGWVTTKKHKTKKATWKRIVAIDCEMCVTLELESKTKVSNSLCRVSVVDGEDMIRSILADLIVHQPEPGHRIVDPKTDIHGISLDQIATSQISVHKAQKYLLKFIDADTIVVGHSVHGDLSSLRIQHDRVIDTSLIFRRREGPAKHRFPGLKCLTKHLLEFEMPDGHDSAIDAQASMLAAKHAVYHASGAIIPSYEELHGVRASKPSNEKDDRRRNWSNRLRVHRIAKGVSSLDIENFFVQNGKVAPVAVEPVQYKDKSKHGSCMVTFTSPVHAKLAFDGVHGLHGNKVRYDKIGRETKDVAVVNSAGKTFKPIVICAILK